MYICRQIDTIAKTANQIKNKQNKQITYIQTSPENRKHINRQRKREDRERYRTNKITSRRQLTNTKDN